MRHVPDSHLSTVEDALVAHHRTPDTVVHDLVTAGRPATKELSRLASELQPGFRLIATAHSRDHLDLVTRLAGSSVSRGERRELTRDPALVTADQVAATARSAGVEVVALQPYGLLAGGPVPWASLLAEEEATHAWRRSLSWLGADEGLDALVRFLELDLAPDLPLAAAHRVLVVLERPAEGPVAGRTAVDWSDPAAGLGRALDPARVETLDRLLEPAHARYVGFRLLAVVEDRLGVDVASLLPADRRDQLRAWRHAGDVDARATRLAHDWAAGVPTRMWRGMDMTLWASYGIADDAVDLFDHVTIDGGAA